MKFPNHFAIGLSAYGRSGAARFGWCLSASPHEPHCQSTNHGCPARGLPGVVAPESYAEAVWASAIVIAIASRDSTLRNRPAIYPVDRTRFPWADDSNRALDIRSIHPRHGP